MAASTAAATGTPAFVYGKAKYAFTGMDVGDLRFNKDEVFLVTKKEGAWWWGMKEPEEEGVAQCTSPREHDGDGDSPGRRVRIVMSAPADQGRFPKNYIIEITREEYLSLKKEQDATRQRKKEEEAQRRQEQEKLWSEKVDQIRQEAEQREREDRRKLKLQKVFGSEGDILLLSPRSQRENQINALSPRQRNEDQEAEDSKVPSRLWHKKKESLPSSLDKVASEYKERKLQSMDQSSTEQADSRVSLSLSAAQPTTSSDSILPEETEAESSEELIVKPRRRIPTPSTMFMEGMDYLAPELNFRAEEARRKRVRGRNAVSLDRNDLITRGRSD